MARGRRRIKAVQEPEPIQEPVVRDMDRFLDEEGVSMPPNVNLAEMTAKEMSAFAMRHFGIRVDDTHAKPVVRSRVEKLMSGRGMTATNRKTFY